MKQMGSAATNYGHSSSSFRLGLSLSLSSQLIAKRHSRRSLPQINHRNIDDARSPAIVKRKIEYKMRRLEAEMKDIGEEQKNIREGQMLVRAKFEAIESECQKLRRETEVITKQGVATRVKLILMFQILKARQGNDIGRATALAQILRRLVSHKSI